MPKAAEAVDLQAGINSPNEDAPEKRAARVKHLQQKATLPRPKGLRVPPKQFFEWAARFNDQQKGRALFHVYREWPVINRKLIKEPKEKLIVQFEGEFPFPPAEYENFFLKQTDWGGSGKYKLMCTEMGVGGCISMTRMSLEDPDYPPVVDPAVLVVGHPENKGYLEGLRASGITIPGDDPEKFRAEQQEKKQMDLASVAFEHMTKTIDKQQDRIEELTERQEELEEEDPEEVEAQAVSTKVLESGLRMIEKQVDRVTAEAAKSYDPIAVSKSVLEMYKEMRSPDSNIVPVLQAMLESQSKMLTAMAEQNKRDADFWRDKALAQATAVAPVVAQNRGMLEQAEELARFKELAQTIFGRPQVHHEPEPERKNWIESLLEHPQFPQVVSTVVQTLGNLAIAFKGGTPAAPGGLPGATPDQLSAALRGQPGPVNGAAPQPAQTDPLAEQRRQTLAFLQSIEKVFIAHFFDLNQEDLNGYTFAYTMHCEFVPNGQPTPEGRNMYTSIRDGWGSRFAETLQAYPPIWNQVQGNRKKFGEFIQEFMTYDAYVKEKNSEVEGETARAN